MSVAQFLKFRSHGLSHAFRLSSGLDTPHIQTAVTSTHVRSTAALRAPRSAAVDTIPQCYVWDLDAFTSCIA